MTREAIPDARAVGRPLTACGRQREQHRRRKTWRFPEALPGDANAADTQPPAFRLTVAFSGLKFSLTWALDGLSRLQVSQLRQCRSRSPAASLTVCGLPTRLSLEGLGSRRRASGIRADGLCPGSIGAVYGKNLGDCPRAGTAPVR